MKPSLQLPTDPDPQPFPAPAEAAGTTAFLQEQESYRRAMPIQRLLAGAMRYADGVALHGMGAAGVAWVDGGVWLAERNLRLAQAAATPASKRKCFVFASACFRFAQVAIPTDTSRKKEIYRRMVDAFGAAGALSPDPVEKLEIPWRDGRLCGWLMRPRGLPVSPAVIVMGGFDGWREEYLSCAQALLEQGVAAFLMDGPGQGETRLFHNLYLDVDFHEAFSCAADHLRALPGIGPVGIWGNSLGGFLAARTAAADDRFAAVCVNGGSSRPMELPERFPRFFSKVEAMMGSEDRDRVMAVMRQMDASATIHQVRRPFLQLHSVNDAVFLLDNARKLYDGVSSAVKSLLVWDEGDHCLYDHFEERNRIVAEWFGICLAKRNN